MDHIMPDMDGVEAVRIIRNEIGGEYAAKIPIIAFTANATVGNEEMFLSKGFQAFLPKPIQISRLDEEIRKWLYNEEQDKWLQVEGLNVEKGIGYFNGNKEVYFNVLHTFVANIPYLLEKIERIEDFQDYSVVIHGVKGSAGGICAEDIENQAMLLENAAKDENYEYIHTNNAYLINAVQDLLVQVNALFAQTNKPSKPKRKRPSYETLFALLKACEKYDAEAAEAAVTELTRYDYEINGELITWIEEKIDRFDFAEIKSKLTNMNESGVL
jgi:CheY-like chemotaxis protein